MVGLESNAALTLDFSPALHCLSGSTSNKESWYLRAAHPPKIVGSPFARSIQSDAEGQPVRNPEVP